MLKGFWLLRWQKVAKRMTSARSVNLVLEIVAFVGWMGCHALQTAGLAGCRAFTATVGRRPAASPPDDALAPIWWQKVTNMRQCLTLYFSSIHYSR